MIFAAFILFCAGSKICDSRRAWHRRSRQCSHWGLCCWSMGPSRRCAFRLATALAVSIPIGIITVFLMSIALKSSPQQGS
jgi:hypothetical protein